LKKTKKENIEQIKCRGAIFDLDGIITQTARVHFKAWKKTFDQYLEKKANKEGKTYRPFSYEDDYLQYVDGKPRYQGVKSFLESRDINLPFGEPQDPPDRESVCGIGNKKNEIFRNLVHHGEVDIYHSTVSFINDIKKRGIRVAVASSSMNCRFVLEKTGLLHLFDTIIDGVISKEFGLNGKPSPDIFLVAADNMRLHPNECFIVEDAISGVEAGRNGNFALVVGVARNCVIEELQAHGADIVIKDMSELSWDDVENWFARRIKEDGWNLTYYGFEPSEEKLRESLTTVGNGYFGTRGCFVGAKADEYVHYPGTYIAGIYNELPSMVYRKKVFNNDFVNCPNWLLIELKIGEGDFINPLQQEVLSYRLNLNMKEGVMSRKITFKDRNGYKTTIESKRIASMQNPHLGGIQFKIVPLNYSERITIRSTLDGTVINYGVPRYRELNSKHLYPISVVKEQGGISLHVRTTTSKINICMHARNELSSEERKVEAHRRVIKDMGIISEELSFKAIKEKEYILEKLVSIYTSKDSGLNDDPEEAAKIALQRVNSFEELLSSHRKMWQKLWDIADHIIEGDRFSQKVIRLHIYHLLVTASPHNANLDTGIPARGLHGEPYRGHIFWDELFILPFFNLHFPEVSRAHLMYRYRRLDAARQYALENGYQGAMYPWQSADTGKEETQSLHFNPVSGTWGPDLSRLQRHVSIAVAYNIWEYFYLTGDLEFLYQYGTEMLVEITRFWASIVRYEKKDDRYHIEGIMGPDEFHEKYPETKKGGLKDNAYTNIMVCWLMHKTAETVGYLPDEITERLKREIGFREEEVEKWNDIVRKTKVVITDDCIISQFDGYMDLEELDWDIYRDKYGNIQRLDRIIKAEGDTPDRYKVCKQADTLMLFFLLSPGQVKHILNIMGYNNCSEQQFMENNYEYYIKRTSHGSTLSYVVHSAILKYLNTHRKDMWERFLITLKSDIYDIQGGTTAEAIHTGVMGGTVDTIFKSFAGINVFKDHLKIEPSLPSHWKKLAFKILLRGEWIDLVITHNSIMVKYSDRRGGKLKIEVQQRDYLLENNKPLEIKYESLIPEKQVV